MTDEKERELPKQQAQDHGPRCPACAAFPRLTHQLLDSRRARTIRLYQCLCGQKVWDD